MTAKRNLKVILVLLITAGCISQKTASLEDAKAIEKAIKSGSIGEDYAERANKTGNLNLQEIAN